MIIFYHAFLWLYRAGVFFASFFNPKARLFIKGRVNVLGRLRKDLRSAATERVWMHCASLGEFEQGKPVLKKLMAANPALVPVISFFSPSGYEIVKKKNEFPHIYYLPMDSYVNAQLWLKTVRPSLVLWVKYEYWFFYLKAIERKKIPLIMVSGVYSRNQIFFKWYGGLYRRMLEPFTHFFVQNHSSRQYLSTLVDKEKITISGDTRCDRVLEVVGNFQPIAAIERFVEHRRVVVCGSTWEADESIWNHYVKTHPDMRFIIAPHEIGEANIRAVLTRFPGSIRYAAYLSGSSEASFAANCLIIDNIGMLSQLYHYAHITYVGGGFGDNGLHNILEPAAHGKPVFFGPVIYKNFEASELIAAGGACSVATALQLEQRLDELINDPAAAKTMGDNARKYIEGNAGASQKIVDFINQQRFL